MKHGVSMEHAEEGEVWMSVGAQVSESGWKYMQGLFNENWVTA